MLELHVEYEGSYYRSLLTKLRRAMRRYPIHVDIVKGENTIYMFSLDDGLSVAFLYRAYLKAKERGLKAELIYSRYIEEDWLPEVVRRLGEKWLTKGLDEKDVKLLKDISITEHMFRRW